MSRKTSSANTIDPEQAIREACAWYEAHANGRIVVEYDVARAENGDDLDLGPLLLTLRSLVD